MLLPLAPNERWPLDGSDGTTLLFRAASDGTPDFIQYLIDRGANVNAKNEQGATPLFYADVSEDNMLVLLKAGADPTVRRSGWSVSEIAAERGYARVQAWLAAQHPPQ
ncbi:hypothetical protein AEAC466_20110 [Asticcacaulis sp. AC466]|uniref:ankyrin repeat domain-containing protein n=1 Tax=Asticcacaulis sp. AC466 TaxID=1282362 RepID=UPI0003C4092A|nr:ankyrin repeat domain-containing protein [Asticcacaulis sp. AC466]ESQ81870.1 hypothetical protein AEAC466_20110 [Asticcacaulis sp. AC466]